MPQVPPPDDEHLIERRVGGRALLEGGWLDVHKDDVALPDGGRATREYIKHPGAAVVVPLLDDGRLVMVRQFRYPIGKVILEFPAGKLDAGEPHHVCAQRERAEETGYRAREWAFACEIHNAAAYSSESIWIWFARGLERGAQRLDAGEFVEVVTPTESELDALAARGGLPDVKTHIGLHWLQRWRAGAWTLQWRSSEDAARPVE